MIAETSKSPVQGPTTRGNINNLDSPTKWLLQTSAHLVNKINPNITITNKNNNLLLKNLTDSDLANINFLVNTDRSKKIGQITAFNVYANDNEISLPGLAETMNEISDSSNTSAFVAGQLLHNPFNKPFKGPQKGLPMTVSHYIDMLSSMHPLKPNTTGAKKTYSIVYTYK
jgi:hypothetical protein